MARRIPRSGPTPVGQRLRAQTFTNRKAEASRLACRIAQPSEQGEHMNDPEDFESDDAASDAGDDWPGAWDEDQYTRAERGDR